MDFVLKRFIFVTRYYRIVRASRLFGWFQRILNQIRKRCKSLPPEREPFAARPFGRFSGPIATHTPFERLFPEMIAAWGSRSARFGEFLCGFWRFSARFSAKINTKKADLGLKVAHLGQNGTLLGHFWDTKSRL
jgi:hypothetical protein